MLTGLTPLQEDGKGKEDHVIYNHGEGSTSRTGVEVKWWDGRRPRRHNRNSWPSARLTLINILGHSNAYKYASLSVDQVEWLIIQNEAELKRDHKIDHSRFLSYLGMATVVDMLLLIYCCFCKKCKLFRRSLNDDCCGRICIRQTVINQGELIS
jgi:hypothetical protein